MGKDKEQKIEPRTAAFQFDTSFKAQDDLGSFCVIGNNSKFVYLAGVEQEEAQKYAAELNHNKQFDLQYV